MCGICQYHRDELPPDAVRMGLMTHPTIFVNETLSRLNPYYLERDDGASMGLPDLDSAVATLYRAPGE